MFPCAALPGLTAAAAAGAGTARFAVVAFPAIMRQVVPSDDVRTIPIAQIARRMQSSEQQPKRSVHEKASTVSVAALSVHRKRKVTHAHLCVLKRVATRHVSYLVEQNPMCQVNDRLLYSSKLTNGWHASCND